jgi:hypothetical protein
MTALAGPLHLLALVLVVSAVGKLVDPWPATGAMRDAGLPVPFRGRPYGGIALGVVEGAVGLVALAVPAWWAATALGAFYAALAGFVWTLRRRDSTAGCGCFGASTTPPGTAHLVLNAAGAVTALTAAVVGVPDIVEVFDEGIGVAVPYIGLLAIGAATVLVAPALSAELSRARAGGAAPRPFSPTGARAAPAGRNP